MSAGDTTPPDMFGTIGRHLGHKIVAHTYGEVSRTIECADCGVIIIDADAPGVREQEVCATTPGRGSVAAVELGLPDWWRLVGLIEDYARDLHELSVEHGHDPGRQARASGDATFLAAFVDLFDDGVGSELRRADGGGS